MQESGSHDSAPAKPDTDVSTEAYFYILVYREDSVNTYFKKN